VWHLSRPLTYRALDHLVRRGWIEATGEEPGDGGPTRTILTATRSGRARLRSWVRTPVPHLRDLRSELLVKLVVADLIGIDLGGLLDGQRAIVDDQAGALREAVAADPGDVVARWRLEATGAAQRFLDQIAAQRA
jgi:PadR family transcriptional regulator AphA